MKWTEEQINILIKMTEDGFSASLIGERIGKSADAVLRKRKRLRIIIKRPWIKKPSGWTAHNLKNGARP